MEEYLENCDLLDVLDFGAGGDFGGELVVGEGHVHGHLVEGEDDLFVLEGAPDGDGGGIEAGTEVLIAGIGDGGFEVAVGVVDVLLVGEEVVAVDGDDADGDVLVGSGLWTGDGENVFGNGVEVLALGVFKGVSFGSDLVEVVGLEAADGEGINEEAGAHVEDGVFVLLAEDGGTAVGLVLQGDVHGEGFAVAGHVEHFGMDDGIAAIDAEHVGRAEEDVGGEGGVVAGDAFFGFEAGGLYLDGDGEGLEVVPALVELGDELVGGDGLGNGGRHGNGEVAGGGDNPATGEACTKHGGSEELRDGGGVHRRPAFLRARR
jgi:hypothetical protein